MTVNMVTLVGIFSTDNKTQYALSIKLLGDVVKNINIFSYSCVYEPVSLFIFSCVSVFSNLINIFIAVLCAFLYFESFFFLKIYYIVCSYIYFKCRLL